MLLSLVLRGRLLNALYFHRNSVLPTISSDTDVFHDLIPYSCSCFGTHVLPSKITSIYMVYFDYFLD